MYEAKTTLTLIVQFFLVTRRIIKLVKTIGGRDFGLMYLALQIISNQINLTLQLYHFIEIAKQLRS